ncbi:MAG: ABC transporter permease [Tissierellia bacterium]|nr:ABC transporter permease [Tissierellia bacterium]MDD4779526.1 ABC transporter permease [Tissierellia bacterium]
MNKKNVNSYIAIGIILLIIPLILGLLANVLSTYDPYETDPLIRLKSPNSEHIMGTDDLGRDVFTRTLYGIRISLYIGFMVTFFSLIIGVVVGTVSAFYPWTSRILMRLVDGIMAFPTIILAISLAGILGSGTKNIIIALSISYFPMIARITKNATLEVLGMEYIESAIALGKNDLYIIFNYILPNIASRVMVQVTFTFAMAILNESILSFLGVGIKVPTPSLGGMVNDGRNYISTAPWIITFPGLIISWIVLSLNMIGDGMRDALDPRCKNRG